MVRAFNRLIVTGVIVLLFIVIASIYGLFMSMFYYGANIASGIEAITSYNFGSQQYQNCVNQHGANSPLCQYIYNQTIQTINNYNNASFWYGILANPYMWITIIGIIGVIAYMLYVQNKG
jgi:magnesium-transporting ATPase (P-type)